VFLFRKVKERILTIHGRELPQPFRAFNVVENIADFSDRVLSEYNICNIDTFKRNVTKYLK